MSEVTLTRNNAHYLQITIYKLAVVSDGRDRQGESNNKVTRMESRVKRDREF